VNTGALNGEGTAVKTRKGCNQRRDGVSKFLELGNKGRTIGRKRGSTGKESGTNEGWRRLGSSTKEEKKGLNANASIAVCYYPGNYSWLDPE